MTASFEYNNEPKKIHLANTSVEFKRPLKPFIETEFTGMTANTFSNKIVHFFEWLYNHFDMDVLNESSTSIELGMKKGRDARGCRFITLGETSRLSRTNKLIISINVKTICTSARIRKNSSSPLIEIMSTLAHEMVHTKQFLAGELAYETARGKVLTLWCGRDASRIGYKNRPWEVEARERQMNLVNAYEKSLKAS